MPKRARVPLHYPPHSLGTDGPCGVAEKGFVKAVVRTPWLVVCARPSGLMALPSEGHLLIHLDGSVLMLMSVYGLLYPFAHRYSKEQTLGCRTLRTPVNHKPIKMAT